MSKLVKIAEEQIISSVTAAIKNNIADGTFIEAEILSQLDLFDANMYEMAEAVGAIKAGECTGRLWMLDNRKLYNHGRKDVSPKAQLE